MDGPLYGWHASTNGNTNAEMEKEELCHANPALPQCRPGIYSYILNNHANMTFLVCYIMAMLGLFIIFSLRRRALAYSLAMFAGLVFETMGYSARVWSHHNQLQPEPFYMQIVCLTVGPAFMAAAIYFCMRRMVVCFGPAYSIISPQTYTRLVSLPESTFCTSY